MRKLLSAFVVLASCQPAMAQDDEIACLQAENAQLRRELAIVREENSRLIEALANMRTAQSSKKYEKWDNFWTQAGNEFRRAQYLDALKQSGRVPLTPTYVPYGVSPWENGYRVEPDFSGGYIVSPR